MNRKSDKNVFNAKAGFKGEFENGLVNPKEIQFKFYVKKDQLRELFKREKLQNATLHLLGNAVYYIKDIADKEKSKSKSKSQSKNKSKSKDKKELSDLFIKKQFIPVSTFVQVENKNSDADLKLYLISQDKTLLDSKKTKFDDYIQLYDAKRNMDGTKAYKIEFLDGKVNILVSEKNGRNRNKVRGVQNHF